MIITDLNYCKRCRKANLSSNKNRTNYCSKCVVNMGHTPYSRYSSSKNFIDTSFEDAICGEHWDGFKKIKYKKILVKNIIDKFSNIKHIISDNKLCNFKKFTNGPFLYLISDSKKNLLKVGQTVNPFNRFSQYHDMSKNKPLKFDLFIVNTFQEQDLYEDKVRNYLEFLGYLLPKDNTNCRLKYI